MVEVIPAEGLGLHTGEAAVLLCRGSGFPRPHLVWSASGDVRIHMELYQQENVLDDYTVSNQLRIENVHSDMSGTYSCAVCVYSEGSGTCEPMEGIPHKHVPVVVYGKFFYSKTDISLSLRSHFTFFSRASTADCQ